jgi:hypothetical protein
MEVTCAKVPELLGVQAESAIREVAEGACPLCHVSLVVHDGRGCCPCCGDSYVVSPSRLDVGRCAEHGRQCQHWEAPGKRTTQGPEFTDTRTVPIGSLTCA